MVVRLFYALAAIGVWLFIASGAVAAHAWNMPDAALRCPDGLHLERGASGDPDMCSSDLQSLVADRRRPYDVRDPPTSAAVALVIVLGGFTLCAWAVARLCRLSMVRAAVLVQLVSVASAGAVSGAWDHEHARLAPLVRPSEHAGAACRQR